jgi:hypothetical protein
MSRETREYLDSLYDGYNEQGPQINWTRGFEGDNDQYTNSNQQQSAGNQPNTNASNWDNTSSVDTNTDSDDWGW